MNVFYQFCLTPSRLLVLILACFVFNSLSLSAVSANSSKTILFVDDGDVLYRPGTIKRVASFRKSPKNPIIAPTHPWEGMIGWSSVYKNQETGKFQLWYQAYQERRNEDRRLRSVVCYAESIDGVNWVKPNLGLYNFYEIKDTNIVLIGSGGYGDRYCNSVVVDMRDPDIENRYKMLYFDFGVGADADKGFGAYLAVSRDGVNWVKNSRGMLFSNTFGAKGMQPPYLGEAIHSQAISSSGAVRHSWRIPQTMSEALDCFYDEAKKKYVIYGKMWVPGPDGGLGWRQAMGRIESKDMLSWGKAELLLATDEHDPAQAEFNTTPVFPYNQMYFSLAQTLDRATGFVDIEFLTSRDGFGWRRDYRSASPIKRGNESDFDAGSILTNGFPVEMGDEVYFYYSAYRGTPVGAVNLGKQIPGSSDYYSGIGLATTPRDRFVAVVSDPDLVVRRSVADGGILPRNYGNITLKPMNLGAGCSIELNANAGNGELRVELLSEAGYRIRGFTKEDAIPIKGDSLNHEVRWHKMNLSDLPAAKYLISVYLDSAEIYALTVNGGN